MGEDNTPAYILTGRSVIFVLNCEQSDLILPQVDSAETLDDCFLKDKSGELYIEIGVEQKVARTRSVKQSETLAWKEEISVCVICSLDSAN
jgi:hypothetical protein